MGHVSRKPSTAIWPTRSATVGPRSRDPMSRNSAACESPHGRTAGRVPGCPHPRQAKADAAPGPILPTGRRCRGVAAEPAAAPACRRVRRSLSGPDNSHIFRHPTREQGMPRPRHGGGDHGLRVAPVDEELDAVDIAGLVAGWNTAAEAIRSVRRRGPAGRPAPAGADPSSLRGEAVGEVGVSWSVWVMALTRTPWTGQVECRRGPGREPRPLLAARCSGRYVHRVPTVEAAIRMIEALSISSGNASAP